MNSKFCSKLTVMNPFHFRNVFSTLTITNAHSQILFSHFASSKYNLSAADITRMFKAAPRLQKLQTLHDVEQFIHMLNKYGFTKVQIANVMRSHPKVICLSSERKLEPKIKLLEGFGFEGQALTKLLTSSPRILDLTLESTLLPVLEFLKNVFQSEDLLVKATLRSPRILSYKFEKTLKPSVAFWEGWGFRGTELSRFLMLNTRVLSLTSLTPAHVDLIHKIGIKKESKMFKYIVSEVASSRMETLEAKIEQFKLCGLSAEETWQVFRASPTVFGCSKESISEKMNFIVNSIELPANYVVKYPSVLNMSLEKRLRPRFLVWQKIKYMNDLGFCLLRILSMTEAKFVSKIIKGHPESETLWSIYQNALSIPPTAQRAQPKASFVLRN